MSRVRNTLEKIRDPQVQSSICEAAYQHVRPVLKESLINCPYALNDYEADTLENLGVTINPHAIQTHTHAAAKVVENRMLEIVGHHLPKDEKVTFIFLKRSKLRYMRRAAVHKDVFVNHNIEPKDFFRYDEESTSTSFSVNTRIAYISDSLHFMEPADVTHLFDRCHNLKTLMATVVLPVEAIHKQTSLFPAIYSINYNEEGFEYIPGSHGGGAYFHKYETLDWLKYSRFIGQDPLTGLRYTITIQMVESLGANHLFLFQRGNFETPLYRTFQKNSFVTFPNIFHPQHVNATKPMPRSRAIQLYLYVKSVNKVTQRDIFAKVRQLISTAELELYDPDELTHIVNYFAYVSELSSINDYDNMLKSSFFKKLVAPMQHDWRCMIEFFRGKSDFNQLLTALQWKDFSYTIKTEELVIATHTEIGQAICKAATTYKERRQLTNLVKQGAVTLADFKEADQHVEYTHFDPEFKSTVDPHRSYENAINNLGIEIDEDVPESSGTNETLLNNEISLAMSSAEHVQAVQEIESLLSNHEAAPILPPAHVKTWASLASDTSSTKNREIEDIVAKLEIQRNEASCSYLQPNKELSKPKAADNNLPWNAWIPLLNAHGFKGDQLQYGPDGNLIQPIQDINNSQPRSDYPSSLPCELVETLRKIKRAVYAIPISHRRASAYSSDIKNNRTGKLLCNQSKEWKESFAFKMQHEDIVKSGVVIHGCGGSGKSQALQNFLRTLGDSNDCCTVVVPTVELRNDWVNKLHKLPMEHIKTFEKAMIQPGFPIVIFDDYTKLPPGYIEAYLFHHANTELFILTGDSRQSVYHESNNEAYIASLDEAVAYYANYCGFYLNATHRNVRSLANKLGVYSEKEGHLKITFASHALQKCKVPILVPSQMKKSAMLDIGHKSMTYAGCQGLTAPKVQILLDNHTQHCSDRVLYTCLSRAVDSIHFINTGPNNSEFWDKLEATPYLKAFIDVYRDEKTEMLNSKPADDSPTEPEAPVTHFPIANGNNLEKLASALPEKFAREIYDKHHGHSNTIQTENPVVQLFQHQQAKDETLFWATIEARLSITTPEANLREFLLKKDVGDILFFNYHNAMCLPADPVDFEEKTWEICAAEVKNTYLAKPMANLINAASRQSPDFDSNKISLFLKSQWVKKVEKLGAIKSKPGQTIAAFMQQTVMLYGTMARYLRKMRQRFQPKHIFINCETTTDDLNKFVKDGWNFNRTAQTNDFTAFDQSQDGAMLQFEVMKAKFFNIPADVIEGYINIKLNAKIFLGTLSIMRLSGEGPTFDANTECSIAYTATRFHIDNTVKQVYAGDDMALDGVVSEKKSFRKLQNLLKLTSKTLYPKQVKGDYAEFCGWTFTPGGIIKNPLKMHASIMLQEAIGNLHTAARSYAIDMKHSYQMGDQLHDYLTPDEAEQHFLAVRKLHKLHQGEAMRLGEKSPPRSTH
uniref:RNA replication protein n=1 Tax=Pepino mosaic virus TaxID=112229 RepID=A0A6H1NPT9_9VIRU|nr:RNA-dependent RNA polymerase [Pepino mosaic virus]